MVVGYLMFGLDVESEVQLNLVTGTTTGFFICYLFIYLLFYYFILLFYYFIILLFYYL